MTRRDLPAGTKARRNGDSKRARNLVTPATEDGDMTPADSSVSSETRLSVVGVGASAGGIGALQELFQNTPASTGLAFVVIVHLSPDHASSLADVLQKKTAMPVREVREGTPILPDHVYVIPPDGNLSSVDGHLEVSPRAPAGQNRAPIDHFFRTLADTHGAGAGGVVLSGTGSDGAQGLRRIKELGGFTIVQDPEESEFSEMPRAAFRTGAIDRVLTVAQIGPELARLRTLGRVAEEKAEQEPESGDGDSTLPSIFGELKRRFGHEFDNYKRATILRRLQRRMLLSDVDSPEDYLALLRSDPKELEALDRDLLIVVTGFFRDPDAFAALEHDVIPGLFAGKGAGDEVRVWVAGCATGEEAYSVAMLLTEQARNVDYPPDLKVFATDLSEHAFNLAREGLYPEGITNDLSAERLVRNFERESGGFRVKKHLRDVVLFATHDILRDPPFSRLDMVVCRNVLIYLRQDAQRRVLELFHYALREEGSLFLGSSESADSAGQLFTTVNKRHKIFRSKGTRSEHVPLRLSSLEPRAGSEPWQERDRPPARKRFLEDLHEKLVEAYAPPSLVVNSDHQVAHLSEHVGRFLRIAGGEPSTALLDMVEGDLRIELRALLFEAFRRGIPVEGKAVDVTVGGRLEKVRPSVRPLLAEDSNVRYCLVLLEPVQPLEATSDASPQESSRDANELEIELKRVKAQLRTVVEDHDDTMQRFQSAYEELQSINEEQRATAEELETSKEELQSVNEELRTVNQEFRGKIEELAEVNDDLRNLINSTDIATIFLDRALAVRRFTPQVVGLFNFVDADIGRPVSDVTHQLDYPDLLTDARAVLSTLEKVEREVPTADGRWFTVRISPYRSVDDRIEGVALTFSDTTDRRRGEEERERLLAEASKANAVKSEFLAVLSHEFRTPLAGIVGYADILDEGIAGQVTDKQRHHLRRIKVGANQILSMVEEILQYAQLDAGKAKVHLSDVDLSALVAEVSGLVVPAIEDKRLELRIELSEELPTLRTDASKVRQILLNLLGNAVKFTKEGHVRIRAEPQNAHVILVVEDTGIGIAPENQVQIFERFWQVSQGETRIQGGTGLGLAVVRDLARLLGGDVAVESALGRGTTFTVLLPLVAPLRR